LVSPARFHDLAEVCNVRIFVCTGIELQKKAQKFAPAKIVAYICSGYHTIGAKKAVFVYHVFTTWYYGTEKVATEGFYFSNLKKAYTCAFNILEGELGVGNVVGGWSYDTAARQIRADKVAGAVCYSKHRGKVEVIIKKYPLR